MQWNLNFNKDHIDDLMQDCRISNALTHWAQGGAVVILN